MTTRRRGEFVVVQGNPTVIVAETPRYRARWWLLLWRWLRP